MTTEVLEQTDFSYLESASENKPLTLMVLEQSFLKSGLECMGPCYAWAFGELTGDLFGESRTEKILIMKYIP